MKAFFDQYQECKEEGLTKGRIKKRITPTMMPCCPVKARKMVAYIKKFKITHFDFVRCGQFGGQCFSGNPHCQKLRQSS